MTILHSFNNKIQYSVYSSKEPFFTYQPNIKITYFPTDDFIYYHNTDFIYYPTNNYEYYKTANFTHYPSKLFMYTPSTLNSLPELMSNIIVPNEDNHFL